MTDPAMALLTAGLWVFALARVTRLLVADRLTDFLRIWAYRRSGGGESMLTYFVQCPWCVSMWLGFATAWIVWLQVDWGWYLYPLIALSGSYLVGVFATKLEPHEEIDVVITTDEDDNKA